MLLMLSADFLQKKSSVNIESVKLFGSRSGPTFVGPDLGLNCLLMQVI